MADIQHDQYCDPTRDSDGTDGTNDLFRTLGKQIKLLREQAGLTQKEFGSQVGYGEHQISAMERGLRTPQPEFLDAADAVLNAKGLLSAAAESVRRAQARARIRHPAWFRHYARLEADAVEVHDYSSQTVPGLLQTEAYARATFTMRRPLLDEETVERRVADRMSRHQIFNRWPPPTMSFVLEEVLLHRPFGGPAVLRGQLERLLNVGHLRSVELQIMPTNRFEHAGIDGPCTLLTPKGKRPQAYIEVQGQSRLITDREEARIIAERYGIIRAQALPPGESLDLIAKLLGEA